MSKTQYGQEVIKRLINDVFCRLHADMMIFWMYWAKYKILLQLLYLFLLTFLLWLLENLKLHIRLTFMACITFLSESTLPEHYTICFSKGRVISISFTVLSFSIENTESGCKPFYICILALLFARCRTLGMLHLTFLCPSFFICKI